MKRNWRQKIKALPTLKAGVIVADPEWEFEPWSNETGMDRAAANHYPTSPVEKILARDVASIAADDCVLFLWATQPMLPQALAVMAAWGFEYKSHFMWIKDKKGTGYWNRNQHEVLLVGTHGNIPAPAPGDQWPSVIVAPRGAHSAKPEIFLEMIEAYFPNLPKIELNRRGPARPGWDAWGSESEPPKSESVRADAEAFPRLVTDCCRAEFSASCHCGVDYVTDDGRRARIKTEQPEDLSIPEFLRREPQTEPA